MPPRTLTDEEARRAHRLYMEGWTYDELASEFHTDASVLRHAWHRLGLPLRGQPTPHKQAQHHRTARQVPISGRWADYVRLSLELLDR